MKREEKKLKFIQARAMGFSLKKTAEKLGVSLASCKKWEKAFKTEVDEAKADNMAEVAEAYEIFRIQRLEVLGATFKRIRDNMAARFSPGSEEIPLAKLLELELKFNDAIKAEFETEQKATPAMILDHLEDVKKGKAAAIDPETLEKIKAALNEITPRNPELNNPPFVSVEEIRAEAKRMGIYG